MSQTSKAPFDGFADFFADELNKQDATDKQSQAMFSDNAAQLKDMQSSMIAELMSSRKKPPLPQPVQEIVAVLVGQPRLVPAVQQFLMKTVADLNNAIDSVLGPMPQPEPPAAEPPSSDAPQANP